MDILILVSIILCFLISLSLWMVMGCVWSGFRKFFHRNYSFFDASFILAYFLEQLILIFLIFKFSNYTEFWTSAFAIIIITTVSFQKFMLESRLKEINQTTTEQRILLERTSTINKHLTKDNEKLEKIVKSMGRFTEDVLEEEG